MLGEKHNIAQELALKDAQDWEKLSEVMHKAYYHNADLVYAERHQPPALDPGQLPPPPVCRVCGDTGWVDGKRCYECNPVGLSPEMFKGAVVELDKVEEIEVPSLLIIPEALPGKTMDETVKVAKELIERSNADSNIGTEPVDNSARGDNTSEPKQPEKPKKAKRSRKKAR